MGDRTFFEDKRHLPQQRIKDTFFDYLLDRILDIATRVWGGERGVFGTLSIVSGGNDKFNVQTLPKDLLDGDGNILALTGSDGTGIQFENSAATTYYVAARHNLVPSGVLRNQRNNVIFYDTEEDRIGEVADPTSVAEVGGTLEIVVDTIFEAGVSHAGRQVTVWLRRALTTEEAVAIEANLTVAWVGGVNKVTTTGLLGQASGAASTDVTDYQVFAQGVTVRKTDLSVIAPYAYIGSVTGGGAGNPPAGFSTLGQIDVSDGINPDLHEAYTTGRTISPSGTYGGAVKIASADSGDEMNSILHLDRKGATENTPVNLANVMDSDGSGQLNLYPLSHATADLQEDEPASINGALDGQVDLTRGGVSVSGASVRRDCDFVYLAGFATAAVNGLHKLASPPSSAVVYLERLDGGSMAGYWSGANGETGTASFLRLGLGVSKYPVGAGSELQFGIPIVVNGQNESVSGSTAIRLYPRQGDSALECYEGNTMLPRLQAMLSKYGTIHAQTTGSPGTPSNELFRSDRFDNSDFMQIGYLAQMGDTSAAPFAALQPIARSIYLLASEDVTLAAAGDTVTFTRGGGLDLTHVSCHISKDLQLLLIYDAANESDNGLYAFSAHTATTMSARTTAGATVIFGGGAAKARVLSPQFLVTGSLPLGGGNGAWLRGITMVLADGNGGDGLGLRIYTENKGKVEIFDGGKSNATSYKDPRTILVVDPTVIGYNNAHPIKLHRATVIAGGSAAGGDEEDWHYRDGLRIWNAGGGIDTRDPAFGLAVDYGFPEHLPASHTWPAFAVDTLGGVARGHHFRDDFFHTVDVPWTNAYPQPTCYNTYFIGSGNIQCRDVWSGAAYGHGCAVLTTGGSLNDVAELDLDPLPFNLDTAKDFRWSFRGRLKPGSTSDIIIRFGLGRSNVNNRYYFQFNDGTWSFVYWDGSTLVSSTETCLGAVDRYQWFEIFVTSSTVFFTVDRKDHASGYYMSGAYSLSPNNNGQSGALGMYCWMQTQANAIKTCVLDYWEAWDIEAIYGRLGNSHNLNHP